MEAVAWEEEKAAKELQNGHATEIACRASRKYGEASKTEPKYKQSPFYPVKIRLAGSIISILILSFITTSHPYLIKDYSRVAFQKLASVLFYF